ncbi:hypothetical protein Tco_0340808 [Tanacetum coccineum]
MGVLHGDTWDWVAPGPERQQVTVVGAPEVVEGAPAVDEGIPAPMQAPQPPPPWLGLLHRGPCCKEIDKLVMVYSGKRRVLNSYGHSYASSTYFCSRTQIGESSRAKYQGSSSF